MPVTASCTSWAKKWVGWEQAHMHLSRHQAHSRCLQPLAHAMSGVYHAESSKLLLPAACTATPRACKRAQLPPPSAEASTHRGGQPQPPPAHRQQRDRPASRCIRSGWGHAGAKGRPRGAHSGRGHSTIGHKRRQLADRFIYICRPLPVRPCICAAGAAAAQAQQPTEALHCAERPPAARRWPTASAATARPASCSGGAAAGGCEGGAGRREGAEPGARCRVRAPTLVQLSPTKGGCRQTAAGKLGVM